MYFIRHGESEFNAVFAASGRDPGIADAPLTARGRAQALAAGHLLKDAGITRILCSPYRRALQTAACVNETLQVPVAVNPLMGERALYSCDIGTPRTKLMAEWPQVNAQQLTDENWWPKQGETQDALERRARAFLALENDDALNATTLAVSHWYFLFALSGLDAENGEILWRDNKGRYHKRFAP